jgi:hypothetical protein
MIVRIFKGVWLISLLGTVAVLLYSYASFPEVIQVQEGSNAEGITRNNLFYAVLGMLGIFNALVIVINRVTPEEDAFFKVWFFGLVVFFNLFITVSLQFFSLYNSQEKFDYDSIGYIIYGSVSLIILWASIYPVNKIIQQFRPKQVVSNNLND